MKLEDQVCTIEQAQVLKDFGITQVGLYEWTIFNSIVKVNPNGIGNIVRERLEKQKREYKCLESYTAFTVEEILGMYPSTGGIECNEKTGKFYRQTAFGNEVKWDDRFTHYKTFTHALADKLIHALREEYISVLECNTRLLID